VLYLIGKSKKKKYQKDQITMKHELNIYKKITPSFNLKS